MLNAYLESTQHFETILDFYRFGLSCANQAQVYCGHGTDNTEDDIRLLLLESLSLPFTTPPQFYDAKLTQEEKKYLASQLAKRILQRIPVPYLIHKAWFCELPFYVDERVLIPRSPFAELIQHQFSPWIEPSHVGHILDLCTGSGCIAIACCMAFPDAQVDAVDLSTDALAVAKINQERHGLHEQLTLIHSDCFKNVPKKRYDVIVSNPPYVGREEMNGLPKEYQHEPQMALEADNNGLAIVDEILHSAGEYLSDEGILIVEVGNSADILIETYPEVPFIWLDFESGGDGVFLLTAEALKTYIKS